MSRSNSVRISDRRALTATKSNGPTAPLPSLTVSPPKSVNKWEFKQLLSDPFEYDASVKEHKKEKLQVPFVYLKMQYLVQEMLHSDKGVPIRSHRSKLLATVPSVFTGSDIVQWLVKRYGCLKSEGIHVANVLYNHGYFYSVEKMEPSVKDDGSLFRFQTPHLWPSQHFDDSDFEYAVYLMKQVLRSKTRLRLEDYELEHLRDLQKKLLLKWDYVNDRATDEARILKEQKKMMRILMENQEKAFWRLKRPPPDMRGINDCLLTKFGTYRHGDNIVQAEPLNAALKADITLLNEMLNMKRFKLSTSLDGIISNCKRYADFDPMLDSPNPPNPWISNDDALWMLERSLVEYPTVRQLKLWACSLHDLLSSVTGRYKFEQFCKKQYCVENVKFWQACCDLKLLPLVSIPGSVKLVYDEFIDPNAPSMVNLNVTAFNEAEKDLKNPTRYAFGAAEEQIYNLMQNDIYPRFLKTDFDMMMKMAHSGSMGKSFFKKFTSRSANKLAADKTNPVEIISPCLPNRYTKRQLSISRGSSNTSGSMDNLFLDLTNWGGDTSPTSENNALVDILTSPSSEIRLTSDVSNNDRVRRVSAPLVNYQGPPGSGGGANNTGGTGENNGQLWMVAEASESEGDIEHCGVAAETEERDQLRREMLKGLGSSLVQSHSMENLKKYRNKNSNGDDDNCDLINCNKVMESGILSLRTPTEDMFDQPALIKLDRKKSNSIENLHGHDTFSPLTSLANFSPPDYCISGDTNELATILVPPNPTYTAYSSSESIHSAISN